jgi:hypothetical protein
MPGMWLTSLPGARRKRTIAALASALTLLGGVVVAAVMLESPPEPAPV